MNTPLIFETIINDFFKSIAILIIIVSLLRLFYTLLSSYPEVTNGQIPKDFEYNEENMVEIYIVSASKMFLKDKFRLAIQVLNQQNSC